VGRVRPAYTPPNTDAGSQERVLEYDWVSDVAVTANGVWWFQWDGSFGVDLDFTLGGPPPTQPGHWGVHL
jgi:hypothetical protein